MRRPFRSAGHGMPVMQTLVLSSGRGKVGALGGREGARKCNIWGPHVASEVASPGRSGPEEELALSRSVKRTAERVGAAGGTSTRRPLT